MATALKDAALYVLIILFLATASATTAVENEHIAAAEAKIMAVKAEEEAREMKDATTVAYGNIAYGYCILIKQ